MFLAILLSVVSDICPPRETPLLAQDHRQPEQAGDQRPVAIPFDFESKFDDGRYGRMVGDQIWKKLERDGTLVIPESMRDVRDWSERTKQLPNPTTSLERLQRIVRDEFGGDLAIWGSVERVAGEAVDSYDLQIRVADFRVTPPRVVYETKARTKTVSEIPHVYVQAALDKLLQRPAAPAINAGALTSRDPAAERRWREGKNLVQGDFEQGAPNPAGWDALTTQISLVKIPGEGSAPTRVVRFTIPEEIAATTGVLYCSDYFPVEAGATYRLQTRWRSTGSAVKIFVKCYDELPTKFPLQTGQTAATERREVYRSQQNLTGPPRTWNVHSEEFTPQHARFTPRWCRVMLYGYWPAGTVDFDDLIVKQLAPAASSR